MAWTSPLLGQPSPDNATAELPVVSVHAPVWQTAEPCPLCRVVPAVLRFERDGATDLPLMVYFHTDGTALPDRDYLALPPRVEIPAGSTGVELLLMARDDLLVEGPEVVRVRLVLPPSNSSAYRIAPDLNTALIVISDDEAGAPQARLDFVAPRDGERFLTTSPIELSVIGVWNDGELDQGVEFFAGGELIGSSPPSALDRLPIPGLPSVHTIRWEAPPIGTHTLTATAPLAGGERVLSPPIDILVSATQHPSLVRIDATQNIAEETAAPLRRIRFDGLFTISRTDATAHDQPVWIHYSGSSTPGLDYPLLPSLVSIPAGATSVEIRVEATVDDIPEPIETLVATLSQCPPHPLRAPCYPVAIDPTGERAVIFLRDDGITQASLDMVEPMDGARFAHGESILLRVIAIDLEGYISEVDFYANNERIGTSTIKFFVPPPPGTPVEHHFEWRDAPPGEHVLTARTSRLPDLVSLARVVIVDETGHAQPPTVLITHPTPGQEFEPGARILIRLQAVDPDGYVRHVRFFADGRQIGEEVIDFIQAPEPGQPQTFEFIWENPLPGPHRLTARVTDNEGLHGSAPPIEIFVRASGLLPSVAVLVLDGFAREPSANTLPNTATFGIVRFGSSADALTVNYSMTGSAENGLDYVELSGSVVILAGNETAVVTVVPLADDELEGLESVGLRLNESAHYRLVPEHRTASAVIADSDLLPPQARCIALSDGSRYLCFPAPNGHRFRFEASSDLRVWQTLYEGTTSDDGAHYVDDAQGHPHRFYRLSEGEAFDSREEAIIRLELQRELGSGSTTPPLPPTPISPAQ